MQGLADFKETLCVLSGAVAILGIGLLAWLFHLGVRDFQDYERQDG